MTSQTNPLNPDFPTIQHEDIAEGLTLLDALERTMPGKGFDKGKRLTLAAFSNAALRLGAESRRYDEAYGLLAHKLDSSTNMLFDSYFRGDRRIAILRESIEQRYEKGSQRLIEVMSGAFAVYRVARFVHREEDLSFTDAEKMLKGIPTDELIKHLRKYFAG